MNIIQYGTIPYNTVQYGTIRDNTAFMKSYVIDSLFKSRLGNSSRKSDVVLVTSVKLA